MDDLDIECDKGSFRFKACFFTEEVLLVRLRERSWGRDSWLVQFKKLAVLTGLGAASLVL